MNACIVDVSYKMRALLFPALGHTAGKRDQNALHVGFHKERDGNGNRFLAMELYTEVGEDSASLYKSIGEVAKGFALKSKYNVHEFYGKKLVGTACGGAQVELKEDEAFNLGIDTEGWPWGWIVDGEEDGPGVGVGLAGLRKRVGWALLLDDAGADDEDPLVGYEVESDDDFVDDEEMEE